MRNEMPGTAHRCCVLVTHRAVFEYLYQGESKGWGKGGFMFSNSSFDVRYDLPCSPEAVYNDNFCAFRFGMLVACALHYFRRHFL